MLKNKSIPVVFSYVDGSNVFVAGMQCAAARRGLAPSAQAAAERGLVDPSWRCNFRTLYGLLFPPTCGEGQAIMFGSYGEPGTAVWEQSAQDAGFMVDLLRRNAHNREKQVDSALTTRMLTDMRYMRPERGDIVTLVSGDSDFVRPIQALQAEGLKVLVHSWDHAASRELIAAADQYLPLDPHIDELTYATVFPGR
jgi:hypothetical protein